MKLQKRFFIIGIVVNLFTLEASVLSGPSLSIESLQMANGGGIGTTSSYSHSMVIGSAVGGVATGGTYILSSRFFVGRTAPQPITEIIDPTIDNCISVTGPSGIITVCIFAGTFSEAKTVTLTPQSNFADINSNVAQLNGTGVGFDLDIFPASIPNKPFQFTVGYTDSDVQGKTEERLRGTFFINSQNRWLPRDSTVNTTDNQVVFFSKQTGTYQLTEMLPSSDVNNVFIYPNPLRPSLGHQEMKFTNIPAGSNVRIFTIRGDLVRNLTSDLSGVATWDGKNEEGKGVVSGVYFGLIRVGGNNKTIRIAVER